MVAHVNIDLSGVGDKIALAVTDALKASAISTIEKADGTVIKAGAGQSIEEAVAKSVARALEEQKVQDKRALDMDEMRKQIMTNAEVLQVLTLQGDTAKSDRHKLEHLQIFVNGKEPELRAAVVRYQHVQGRRFWDACLRIKITLEPCWRLETVVEGPCVATDQEALRLLLLATREAVDDAWAASEREINGFFQSRDQSREEGDAIDLK